MPSSRSYSNLILQRLSSADIDALHVFLEPVDLIFRSVIEEFDSSVRHVHFIEGGVVSIVAATVTGQTVEVLIVGCEGLTGVSAVLGPQQAALRSTVQVAGTAYRISVSKLHEAMSVSPTLRHALLHHAYHAMVRLAQTAVSLGHFTVRQRVARWILMVDDRTDGSGLNVTHDALARLLAVRRSGVTEVLKVLEVEGTITTSRAKLVVLDRAKLLEIAGPSYLATIPT
jgi:CRP-like cAMP-binding protein